MDESFDVYCCLEQAGKHYLLPSAGAYSLYGRLDLMLFATKKIKQLILISAVLLAAITLVQPVLAAGRVDNTLVVSFMDDVATLDPAIGYDWQNYHIINALFSGLLTLSPETGKPVLNLAEKMNISEDGKTYDFQLRKGVKFHNGREVTAQDVKYSLERVINPKTASPGASFFKSIEGFEAMRRGDKTELSGIEVLDRYRVRLRTATQDATFLNVLAINFGLVVPREEVEKGDFGRHPVGSGPFRLAEWTQGKQIVFKRFEDYHEAGLPRLDSIVFLIKQNPQVAVLKLERGQVDLLGDRIPFQRLQRIKSAPRYKEFLLIRELLHTSYLSMNSRIPPFDNAQVRQAVNMVIDKEKIIQFFSGTAQMANQILPPQISGHDQDFSGFHYIPEQARVLLAKAGVDKRFRS